MAGLHIPDSGCIGRSLDISYAWQKTTKEYRLTRKFWEEILERFMKTPGVGVSCERLTPKTVVKPSLIMEEDLDYAGKENALNLTFAG
ncbi:hypothetical protein C0995_006500 [Termitomyces sp. Mi166|nr:hypothetical protein C0995_006500 [Termitomyces sp. Mi166\